MTLIPLHNIIHDELLSSALMALIFIALLCGSVLVDAGPDESPLPDQLEANLDDDFDQPLLFASPPALSPTLTPPLMRQPSSVASTAASSSSTALRHNSLFATRPDLHRPPSSKGVGKKRTRSELGEDSLEVYGDNDEVSLLGDISFSNGMPIYVDPNEDDGAYGFDEILQSLGYRDVFKDTKNGRRDGEGLDHQVNSWTTLFNSDMIVASAPASSNTWMSALQAAPEKGAAASATVVSTPLRVYSRRRNCKARKYFTIEEYQF